MDLGPRQQGDIGELSAMQWLAEQGATVAVPFGHAPDFDVVAIFPDSVPTLVQVKTTTCERNGRWVVTLATRGGNQSWSGLVKRFDATRCDTLFVLAGDGRRWYIPAGAVEGGRGILLGGPKYSEFEVEPGRPIQRPARTAPLHSIAARRGTEAVKRGGL